LSAADQFVLQLPRATCQTWRKIKPQSFGKANPARSNSDYQQLHREVQKFANVLKSLCVKKGDRVAI